MSVLADTGSGCRRGLVVKYEGPKVHVGNGVVCQTRNDWFGPTAANQ